MKKTPASNRGTKNGSTRSTAAGTSATERSSSSTPSQSPRRPKQ